MKSGHLAIFAPQSGREFGEAVCRHLGISLNAHEEREFEDGEHKMRPLESVRGKDVFVIQSLYGDAGQSVNDKLCRLLVPYLSIEENIPKSVQSRWVNADPSLGLLSKTQEE